MGRSLRVALLSYRSKPHGGGQGVYVRALSRELRDLGHRVEVFSGQPYPELDDGVPLTRVPSLDLYREPDPFRTPRPGEFRGPVDVLEWATMCTAGFPEPLTFSLRAARLLGRRTADFDVVHDNQSLGYGLLQLRRRGLPTVATVHHPIAIDRDLELAAATGLRRRLTLRRWYAFTAMQGRVARRLDGLTTVSESSRQDIERHLGVPAGGVQVVPVGIDPDVFRPPGADVVRDPAGIVVTTSADVPLKGLVHLLEALAKLRTERDVRLTVVGTARPGGPAALALDRLGLGDAVRFTGPVPTDELVRLLQTATVVAVPSLYEGFSLPAVEAMACGTPLVTTDAGALPEVVGSHAGVQVPAGDVGRLAEALQLVLDHPSLQEQLGRAGRTRVLGAYTWRRTAERTAEWYADVLDRTSGGATPERPVLTVDYDLLDVRPGMRVLDLGCGEGRHAFEAYRRGAAVLAVDWGQQEVATTAEWLGAIAAAGEAPAGASAAVARGDLRALPVPDASVDRVIASEVLEHIPDDRAAFAEIARVLRPGGRVAVTVPRYGPERICWALSDAYHANEGGHVRIYRGDQLWERLAAAGLQPTDTHHAHALHAPYWWLKCAVGVDRDTPLTRAYHRLLVWDLVRRPWATRTAERLLDPLVGKSFVIYADKPAVAGAGPAADAPQAFARG